MKFIRPRKLFLFCLALSPLSLAQDFEIEQEASVSDKGLVEYLEEHFSGSIYHGYGNFQGFKKNLSVLDLSFVDQYKFFSGKVQWQYYFLHYSFLADLKYKDAQGNQRQKRIDLIYEKNGWDFLEFYGKLDFLKQASFSYGKMRPIWGQLEIFSPMDFVLPLDTRFISISPSRASLRIPTEVAILNYFPSHRWDLSAYYFPKIEIDPIFTNTLLDEEYNKKRPIRVHRPTEPDNETAKNLEVPLTMPQGPDQAQYALRALYYGDWATVGMTYFYGPGIMLPFGTIARFRRVGDFWVAHPQLPRLKVAGLELSKAWKNWTFKLDGIYVRGPEEPLVDDSFSSGDEVAQGAFNELLHWINHENDGVAGVPIFTIFMGAGFDYHVKPWMMNFYIYYYHMDIPPEGKRMLDVAKRAGVSLEGYSPKRHSFGVPFPTVNILRTFQDGQYSLGGILGFLSGGVGAALYGGATFWDRLSLGASLQAALDVNSASIAAQLLNAEEGIRDVELVSAGEIGLRLLVSFKF